MVHVLMLPKILIKLVMYIRNEKIILIDAGFSNYFDDICIATESPFIYLQIYPISILTISPFLFIIEQSIWVRPVRPIWPNS